MKNSEKNVNVLNLIAFIALIIFAVLDMHIRHQPRPSNPTFSAHDALWKPSTLARTCRFSAIRD